MFAFFNRIGWSDVLLLKVFVSVNTKKGFGVKVGQEVIENVA